MTTILHSDDHPLMIDSVKALLESFVPNVHTEYALNGDQAFEKIKNKDYDLIILDISMHGKDPVSLIMETLTLRPLTKILILSMHEEALYAKRYYQAGVKGYVTKQSETGEIIKAINTVLSGRKYVSAALADIFAADGLANNTTNPFERLSNRELEVVQHLVLGQSSSEISNILRIKPSTVGTLKSRIFEKLNCSNVIDITYLAKVNNINRA